MCGGGGSLCGSSYEREMEYSRCGSGSMCGSRDADLNGLHSVLSCSGTQNRRRNSYYEEESNIVDVVDMKREYKKAFRKR